MTAKKEKKIAILGTTPTRMAGPINDESWEIWTIGPGGKDHHRWDRLFETHTTWPEDFGALDDKKKSYLDDLSQVKKPQIVHTIVDMRRQLVEWAYNLGHDEKWLNQNIRGKWPAQIVIDREGLFKKYRRMWFSTSICYAVAMAIEEGATDIGCWGIDLESGEEYIAQHWGCAYFLDLARLAGVNLHFPPGSGLTRDINPYPDCYETHLALTLEKKAAWLDTMLKQAEPEHQAAMADVSRIEGAIMTLEQVVADPSKAKPEEIEGLKRQLVTANSKVGQLTANINHLKGEKSATQYYRRMYVFNMMDPG